MIALRPKEVSKASGVGDQILFLCQLVHNPSIKALLWSKLLREQDHLASHLMRDLVNDRRDIAARDVEAEFRLRHAESDVLFGHNPKITGERENAASGVAVAAHGHNCRVGARQEPRAESVIYHEELVDLGHGGRPGKGHQVQTPRKHFWVRPRYDQTEGLLYIVQVV